jgi:hypothetical protein
MSMAGPFLGFACRVYPGRLIGECPRCTISRKNILLHIDRAAAGVSLPGRKYPARPAQTPMRWFPVREAASKGLLQQNADGAYQAPHSPVPVRREHSGVRLDNEDQTKSFV